MTVRDASASESEAKSDGDGVDELARDLSSSAALSASSDSSKEKSGVKKMKKKMMMCSRCQSVRYCSESHHKLDYGRHKKECKLLAKLRQSDANKHQMDWAILRNSHASRSAVGDHRGAFKAAKKSYDLACGELADAIRSDPDGCPLVFISYNQMHSLLLMGDAKAKSAAKARSDSDVAMKYFKEAYALAVKERPHLAYWEAACAATIASHTLESGAKARSGTKAKSADKAKSAPKAKSLKDAEKYLLIVGSNKKALENLPLRVEFFRRAIQHAALAAEGRLDKFAAPLAQAENFYAELDGNPGMVHACPIVPLLALLSHAMTLACGARDFARCRKYGAKVLEAMASLEERNAVPQEHAFGDAYIFALFWYFQGCQLPTDELEKSSSHKTGDQNNDEKDAAKPWLTWLDELVGNGVAFRALTFYKERKHTLDAKSESLIQLLGAQVMSLPVCFPPDVFDGIPVYSFES